MQQIHTNTRPVCMWIMWCCCLVMSSVDRWDAPKPLTLFDAQKEGPWSQKCAREIPERSPVIIIFDRPVMTCHDLSVRQQGSIHNLHNRQELCIDYTRVDSKFCRHARNSCDPHPTQSRLAGAPSCITDYCLLRLTSRSISLKNVEYSERSERSSWTWELLRIGCQCQSKLDTLLPCLRQVVEDSEKVLKGVPGAGFFTK